MPARFATLLFINRINSYTNNNSSLILKFKERVRNLQTRIIEKPEKLTSDRVFYNYFSIQQ